MKILYHHRTASRDGQAVHIEEMIEALRAEGHEVRVVAPAAGDPGEMGGNVSWVHRLKAALPNALYELLELAYSLHAYRKLAAAAREFQPDVNLREVQPLSARWQHAQEAAGHTATA